jgi:hypothetical protein
LQRTAGPYIWVKNVLTPLKWDVCINPESRHRSAALPIAMSSSSYGGAKPIDLHLLSTIRAVDEEIFE